MKLKHVVRWSLLGLIFVGLASGHSPMLAAPPTGSPAVLHDVSLHEAGVLRGLVVNERGASLANVDVALVQKGDAVARTRSAADGSFAVSGLRGGIYQVSTNGVVGSLRLWAPHTAPPIAEDEALVIHRAPAVYQDPVVYQVPPAATAHQAGHVWRVVSNPWFFGRSRSRRDYHPIEHG